jgi:hypothetical protein
MDKIRPLANQGLAHGQKSLDAVDDLKYNAVRGRCKLNSVGPTA